MENFSAVWKRETTLKIYVQRETDNLKNLRKETLVFLSISSCEKRFFRSRFWQKIPRKLSRGPLNFTIMLLNLLQKAPPHLTVWKFLKKDRFFQLFFAFFIVDYYRGKKNFAPFTEKISSSFNKTFDAFLTLFLFRKKYWERSTAQGIERIAIQIFPLDNEMNRVILLAISNSI